MVHCTSDTACINKTCQRVLVSCFPIMHKTTVTAQTLPHNCPRNFGVPCAYPHDLQLLIILFMFYLLTLMIDGMFSSFSVTPKYNHCTGGCIALL